MDGLLHWLMKTEPEEFSYADLESRGREPWNGVKNPTALKHMREMSLGDLVFIYHTGNERSIVGVARVATPPYPDPLVGDPKRVVVDVEPVMGLDRPVTLAEIKADAVFAEWELVRISRLSVMPVRPEWWAAVIQTGGGSGEGLT